MCTNVLSTKNRFRPSQGRGVSWLPDHRGTPDIRRERRHTRSLCPTRKYAETNPIPDANTSSVRRKRGSHLLCSPKRPSLCGCEPRPEVGRILDAKLSEETLKEMKFNERVAFRRQVLDG